MIDPKLLRSAPEEVAHNLARRGYRLDVRALQALEDKRRHWQIESDRLRAARNAHAKAVGQARARGEDIAPLTRAGEEFASSSPRRTSCSGAGGARALAARAAESAA